MNAHTTSAARFACARAALVSMIALVPGLACTQTTVTVLTQAPPGRSAFVDSETRTLNVTRGVAVALECTAWNDTYSGPCRELAFELDDEAIATLLPVHLDALPGQTVRSSAGSVDETTVVGPQERAGFVLIAAEPGTGALTISTPDGPPVSLELVVEEPPAPPADG